MAEDVLGWAGGSMISLHGLTSRDVTVLSYEEGCRQLLRFPNTQPSKQMRVEVSLDDAVGEWGGP